MECTLAQAAGRLGLTRPKLIKLMREKTGLGLAEAKDAVEALERGMR